MDIIINFDKIDLYTEFIMSNFSGFYYFDSLVNRANVLEKAEIIYHGKTDEFLFIWNQLEREQYFKTERGGITKLLEKGKSYVQSKEPKLNNVSLVNCFLGDNKEEVANQLWNFIGPEESLFRFSGPKYYSVVRQYIPTLPTNLDNYLERLQRELHLSTKPSRSRYYVELFKLLDDNKVDYFLSSLSEEINNKINGSESKIAPVNNTEMESLSDYLKKSLSDTEEIQPQKSATKAYRKANEKKFDPQKVFIVHGHDDTLKTKVENVLLKLGLTPVILHKQVNGGKTIIEKFESNAEDCGFAIVLLTSDDFGYAKETDLTENNTFHYERIEKRARQNVVFELGYFVGHLGRERVFILKDDDCFKPGDYDGVVYESTNNDAEWKNRLVMELKNCGYDVDANLILE